MIYHPGAPTLDGPPLLFLEGNRNFKLRHHDASSEIEVKVSLL